MRVLVVGAGSIGRRHHENLENLGAQSTLRGWRNYDIAALETDLARHDAMVIATATDIRLSLIECAARAGKPVYVEKPLAASMAEFETIARVVAPIAGRSMLGYMMRYHPAFRVLTDSDRADVFHFSLTIGHDVTQWRQNWHFSQSYAARANGGGVLLDLCHEIDMAACLFPGLALNTVESLGHEDFPGVDMISRLGLENAQALGNVEMDYLTPALHRRTILHGTRQMFDFDFATEQYRIVTSGGVRMINAPLNRNEMFLAAMRDFLALVQGHVTSGNPALPRLDLALPSARLVAEARDKRRFVGTVAKELS